MRKIKPLDFQGQTIFCGLDVHKKSWRVNIRSSEYELEDYSQDPSELSLLNHLQKRYPGASYEVVYEAGFCGFGIQRTLDESGVNCILVNPSDVRTSQKEKRRKTDKIDARKLSRELATGHLEPIYVPEVNMEHARSLVRQRTRLVRDQTRCKNRIWHLLMFSGLKIDDERRMCYWSRRFIQKLKSLPYKSEALKETVNIAIEEYLLIRELLIKTTTYIRKVAKEQPYCEIQRLLQSVPGIGIVNSMTIMSELQNMERFKTLDKLCSYAGIVPDTGSSGENDVIKGMTHRNNPYLRPALIESSWVIIRKDPAMLMLYKRYCTKMIPKKAIVKIARHLLSRIRYIWINKIEYEAGIIG